MVNEIVITDENGNDVSAIVRDYGEHVSSGKIKVYVNDKQLGAFLNKLNAISKASNIWVAIIDSDNYVDNSYFETAYNYIKTNNLDESSMCVLQPIISKPSKHIAHWNGHQGFNYVGKFDEYISCQNIKKYNMNEVTGMLNTCNYVINKNVISKINYSNEKIPLCVDGLFFGVLCLEQIPEFKYYIVNNMYYFHTVHDGSTYIKEYRNDIIIDKMLNQRLMQLL